MTGSKVTELTDISTNASGDDLLYIVDAPGGTPAPRKISLTNLFGSLNIGIGFGADATYDIGSSTVRPAVIYSDVMDAPTIRGGSSSGGNLILDSTSHGTPGLVKFGGGTDAYYQESLSSLRVPQISTTSVVNVKSYGAVGSGAVDDTVAIQAALDAVGNYGTVYFPQGLYKVTGSGTSALTLTKFANIVGDNPVASVIRGDSLGVGTSVLKVAFTDPAGDSRNWRIENLTITCNASGKHALWFEGGNPIYQSVVRNCNLAGYPTNTGYDLYINSTGFAHNVIELNTFSTGIYLIPGDANVIRRNMFFGERCAITLNAAAGVYNNTIESNTIVSRDGAVHVINGDAVRILNNQIELATGHSPAANQTATSAMVYLQGVASAVRNTVISGNNFGGGTSTRHLIYCDWVEKPIITQNQLLSCGDMYSTGTIGIASGVVTLLGGVWPTWSANGRLKVDVWGAYFDVASLDSDTQITLKDLTVDLMAGKTYSINSITDIEFTSNSLYAVYKHDNAEVELGFNLRPRTAFRMEILDNGVGTAGVLQSEDKYTGSRNGWTGGEFYRDCDGVVHFYTPFQAGTITAGTLMGTLPVGFQPYAALTVPCSSDGGVGWLKVATNGQIRVGTLVDNVNVMPASFVSGQTEGTPVSSPSQTPSHTPSHTKSHTPSHTPSHTASAT